MSEYNIMVVDDQPSVCKEVATFLKDAYTVHAFKSGDEALAYLEDNPADLILLDYDMPGKTGFEVLMAIRMNMSTKNTPVIFLTSETNERMRHEMLSRGANDYLCKPVKYDDLHACIEKFLT